MANYSGFIMSNALGVSRTGKDFVSIQIKVENDLDTREPCDRVYFASLWLSEKAAERTVKTLREIGFAGTSLGDLNDPKALYGVPVEITTNNEEYNGKVTEKVAFVNAPGAFENRGLKPCSDADRQRIARSFDALLRANPAPAAKQTAQAVQKAPPLNPQPRLVEDAGQEDFPW